MPHRCVVFPSACARVPGRSNTLLDLCMLVGAPGLPLGSSQPAASGTQMWGLCGVPNQVARVQPPRPSSTVQPRPLPAYLRQQCDAPHEPRVDAERVPQRLHVDMQRFHLHGMGTGQSPDGRLVATSGKNR